MLLRLVGVLAAAALAAGCGSGSGSGGGAAAPTIAPTATHAGVSVLVRRTALGSVLVDGAGRTLYLLTADRPGHRSCAGPCLYVWPPVLISGRPTAGPGVSAHLGTLAVSGGRQLTINGYPAYTYGADSSPGQTNGQGVASYGGIWWVFRPDGSALR